MKDIDQLRKKNWQPQSRIDELEKELHQMTISRNTALLMGLLAAFLGFIIYPNL